MRKKELKEAVASANSYISQQGREITALKRQVQDLTELNGVLVGSNRELHQQLAEKQTPADGPERPNRQKLTEQEVKDIRRSWIGGMSQKALAALYNVNPATISRTVRGLYH